MFTAGWPDIHIAALKERHASGMSFALIAADINATFGTNYSRCACIGKARRIGLSSAHKPQAKPRAEKPEPVVHHRRRPRRMLPAIPREEIKTHSANVLPRNLTIYELTDATCKWPFGDAAPYTFCGCQTFPGFPYCAEHVALGTSEGRGFSQSILQTTASRRSNVGTGMMVAGLSSLDGEDAA